MNYYTVCEAVWKNVRCLVNSSIGNNYSLKWALLKENSYTVWWNVRSSVEDSTKKYFQNKMTSK